MVIVVGMMGLGVIYDVFFIFLYVSEYYFKINGFIFNCFNYSSIIYNDNVWMIEKLF